MKTLSKNSRLAFREFLTLLAKNAGELKLSTLVVYLFTGLLAISCEQETIVLDDIKTDANRIYSFAGPLGSMRVNMSDFIEKYDEDTVITSDKDGNLSYNFKAAYSFELQDIRLDSLIVHLANMQLSSIVPPELNADVTISLPQVTKDEEPFSISFKTGEEAGDNVYNTQKNLAGYKVAFKHDTENPSGYVDFKIEFDNLSFDTGVI